jgi:hypothetical protein
MRALNVTAEAVTCLRQIKAEIQVSSIRRAWSRTSPVELTYFLFAEKMTAPHLAH